MLSEKGEIDMNNNTKFQWIDNDTDVSEILKKCPKHIHKMIEEMEQADLEDNVGVFYAVSDDFEVATKMLMLDDIISKKDWETLCYKYSLPY